MIGHLERKRPPLWRRQIVPNPPSLSSTVTEAATIRPATAEDIPPICDLINHFAAQGLMLSRTPDQVRRALSDFMVAEWSGQVVGCGALAALDGALMEIRSLAVRPDMHGRGVGGRLVAELLDRAQSRSARRVCALTLSPRFFEKQGFHGVDRWEISPKIWQECVYCPRFHRCDEVAMLKAL